MAFNGWPAEAVPFYVGLAANNLKTWRSFEPAAWLSTPEVRDPVSDAM